MPIISITLDDEDISKVKRVAKKDDRNFSSAVRKIIKDYKES